MNLRTIVGRGDQVAFAFLLAFLTPGCVRSGFFPKYVVITQSQDAEYPFRAEIHATEVGNFNVHEMKPDHFEQETVEYVYLKQSTGELHEDGFSFGFSDKPTRRGNARGVITLTKSEMTISIKFRAKDDDPNFVAYVMNGTYPISVGQKR